MFMLFCVVGEKVPAPVHYAAPALAAVYKARQHWPRLFEGPSALSAVNKDKPALR
jgi:hypothetical protein